MNPFGALEPDLSSEHEELTIETAGWHLANPQFLGG
jgi:hypothetical protein